MSLLASLAGGMTLLILLKLVLLGLELSLSLEIKSPRHLGLA